MKKKKLNPTRKDRINLEPDKWTKVDDGWYVKVPTTNEIDPIKFRQGWRMNYSDSYSNQYERWTDNLAHNCHDDVFKAPNWQVKWLLKSKQYAFYCYCSGCNSKLPNSIRGMILMDIKL